MLCRIQGQPPGACEAAERGCCDAPSSPWDYLILLVLGQGWGWWVGVGFFLCLRRGGSLDKWLCDLEGLKNRWQALQPSKSIPTQAGHLWCHCRLCAAWSLCLPREVPVLLRRWDGGGLFLLSPFFKLLRSIWHLLARALVLCSVPSTRLSFPTTSMEGVGLESVLPTEGHLPAGGLLPGPAPCTPSCS